MRVLSSRACVGLCIANPLDSLRQPGRGPWSQFPLYLALLCESTPKALYLFPDYSGPCFRAFRSLKENVLLWDESSSSSHTFMLSSLLLPYLPPPYNASDPE